MCGELRDLLQLLDRRAEDPTLKIEGHTEAVANLSGNVVYFRLVNVKSY